MVLIGAIEYFQEQVNLLPIGISEEIVPEQHRWSFGYRITRSANLNTAAMLSDYIQELQQIRAQYGNHFIKLIPQVFNYPDGSAVSYSVTFHYNRYTFDIEHFGEAQIPFVVAQ